MFHASETSEDYVDQKRHKHIRKHRKKVNEYIILTTVQHCSTRITHHSFLYSVFMGFLHLNF